MLIKGLIILLLLSLIIFKKQRKLTIKFLVSTLIFLGLKTILNIDYIATFEVIRTSQIEYIVYAILTCFLSNIINSLRWYCFCRANKINIKFKQLTLWFFESLFANNFLPTNFGGDAIRVSLLKKNTDKQNLSWDLLTSTVLIDRILGFLVMFWSLPFILTFINSTEFAHLLNLKYKDLFIQLSYSSFLFIPAIAICKYIPVKLVQKIYSMFSRYIEKPLYYLPAICLSGCAYILLIITNIFVSQALYINNNAIPYYIWAAIIPLATLANFIVPSIKGVGAREALIIYLLSSLSMDVNVSVGISLLSFFVTLISSLPGFSIIKKTINILK